MQDQEGNISVIRNSTFTMIDSCRYLINVGSVGQPRDGDRRACYVTFDGDAAGRRAAWRDSATARGDR